MPVGPNQFESFAERLLAQLHSLEEQFSAIHDEHEANRKEQKESQDRIQLRLSEIAASPDEKRKAKTYRKVNLGTQIALAVFTLGAFIAACVYAGIAAREYPAIKKSADAAKNAADTAANALELSERPWIAVKELRLANRPYWEIFQGPKFFPPTKEMTMVTNLHVPSTFSLDNAGKSPATRVFVSVQIEPVEIGRYFHKPQLGMQMACSTAEAESQEASKPGAINEGSAIFPGAPLSQVWEPVYGVSQPNLRIDEVWINVCVVYRAEFSTHIYHTKVWFESVPRTDAARLVPIGSNQRITWKPFDTFVLYDSEAD
ncbi:MAG: hypothetical protein WDM87_01590 [Terracidiphilus sp.]